MKKSTKIQKVLHHKYNSFLKKSNKIQKLLQNFRIFESFTKYLRYATALRETRDVIPATLALTLKDETANNKRQEK